MKRSAGVHGGPISYLAFVIPELVWRIETARAVGKLEGHIQCLRQSPVRRRRWLCPRCPGETLQLRSKERVHGNQVTLESGIPKYRADALEFAPCGVVSVALQAVGEHTAARRE
jgi:hypothetical protein